MARKAKIFVSWSKDKSKKLANATKNFLEKTFGNAIQFFFSPELYKGTCADNEIHENLLNSDKCLVCITSDNFKNPWLLYEAGVIYGANYSKAKKYIVVPILFEDIPEWSSWIDKPLNKYVPIQIQNCNKEFDLGKSDFERFLKQISSEFKIRIRDFSKNWDIYENEIKSILAKEQLIPSECKFLVNKLIQDEYGNFSIMSPEITRERILFYKGFSTQPLIKILIESVTKYQGKYLWFYGRRNKKLMSRENKDFFVYLANEGLESGVDFRCLFPLPNSPATDKACSKDRIINFKNDLLDSLMKAVRLKNELGLPVEKLFKLYSQSRTDSIIRSDNSILFRHMICDSEGYPLPQTNTGFEIISALENENENRGYNAIKFFETVWDNAKPLTEAVFKELYGFCP